ncbi:hypothetical protein EDD85DRAFT_202635 [Armillaria nabsnona]|nr:hypothetical protein EDD85DRAFT_202635 [Armillaria nabsnona]
MKINITGGATRTLYQAQAPAMIVSIVSNTSLPPVLPNDDNISLNVLILVTVACVLSVFLSIVLLFFFCPRFRGWLEIANQLFARHIAPLSVSLFLRGSADRSPSYNMASSSFPPDHSPSTVIAFAKTSCDDLRSQKIRCMDADTPIP